MANGKRKGAPSKLTDELQSRIVELLRNGAFVETACNHVGISKVSFYTWRKQGRVQKRGRYRDFLNATNKAQADAELALVSIVQAAAYQDWKAAAWILVRMNPRTYSETKRTELTGRGGKPIEHNVKRGPEDYTDDELAAIIAAGGESKTGGEDE